MKEIIFTIGDEKAQIPLMYHPIPATKNIPQWYKEMVTTQTPGTTFDIQKTPTIKKCMPVFDAMTAGYLICLHTDIHIGQGDEGPTISWSTNKGDLIAWHFKEQVENYRELKIDNPPPKYINPWLIKTEKGYSVLIIPPMHRPKTGIRILEGVVDTDAYTDNINFPFMVDEGFEGVIEAGTPIAQIIPFKRDNFKMRIGGSKERKERAVIITTIKSVWLNGYKKFYRQPKNYQ